VHNWSPQTSRSHRSRERRDHKKPVSYVPLAMQRNSWSSINGQRIHDLTQCLAHPPSASLNIDLAGRRSTERQRRRENPRDIEDVVVKRRTLDLDEIRAAIVSLPDATQREAASENIFLVELVVANERKFT
jgi:hypothetical protein